MTIDDGEVRDLLDDRARLALAAWVESFPDGTGFAVWEDLALSGYQFRVRRGALHVAPEGWARLRGHLESIGVNPADRQIGPHVTN